MALVAPNVGVSELWIVGTARVGDEVGHWAQGPYSAGEGSVTVELALPSEILASPLAVVRTGTVSVGVLAQDAEGLPVGRWALPRLAWTLAGSTDGLRGPGDDSVSADL